MAERPIIIRGGSLFIESEEPLDFRSNASRTQWELQGAGTVKKIKIKKAKKTGDGYEFDTDSGMFGIELIRKTTMRKAHKNHSSGSIVLVVAAVGLVAWLLSRRS